MLEKIIADRRVHSSFYLGQSLNQALCAHRQQWRDSFAPWQASGVLNLIAHRRDDGAVAGAIQFTGRHVGYYISPCLWGQGLGHEMVSASVMSVPTMLGLQSVVSIVSRDNTASRKILEKCGFWFTGLDFHRSSAHPGRIAVLRYRRNVD